jgi:hypothetical protein
MGKVYPASARESFSNELEPLEVDGGWLIHDVLYLRVEQQGRPLSVCMDEILIEVMIVVAYGSRGWSHSFSGFGRTSTAVIFYSSD